MSRVPHFNGSSGIGLRASLLVLIFGLAAAGHAELSPDEIRLSAEARGVLAHQCTKCHGQQKQKGGLRLDTKAAAMKGGDSGAVLVPGVPGESVLIQRITFSKTHDDVMPPDGGSITPAEIETLKKWVAAGAVWPDGETAGIVFQRAPIAPRKPEFHAGTEALDNPIDRFVAGYFAQQKTEWPEPVDDRTFLRRASLDAVGLLPTWVEAQKFDGNRAKAVDALLARDEDYATHWLSAWNDALRNDYTGAGYIGGGRKQITKWLYTALVKDLPYDQFARELIAPGAASEGFVKGIRWRGNVSAGARVELQAAQSVAQVFLGLNLKCASCHDSFTNDYKLKDAHALAAVFADKPLGVFRCDKPTGEKTSAGFFWLELGTIDAAKPKADRQAELASLLTKKENGRLSRSLVNRLWAACFGRGLIEPVDAMDNRAWSQDVLDWLAWDFAENGYKVKRTLRLILTSRTYQLPAVQVASADDLAKSSFVFRGPVVRRMSAEQFSDAVSRIASPLYSKPTFGPEAKGAGMDLKAAWIWHEEGEAASRKFPEGVRYFRKTVTLPAKSKVTAARVVCTADNAFTLHVNGGKAASGTAWNTAESADVTASIRGESVTLAVAATNTKPGVAGLRLALAIWLEGQKAPTLVETGADWVSSADGAEGWSTPAFDDRAWKPARVLGTTGLPWTKVSGFTLSEDSSLVRAALVPNDPLQNVLGRPIRDQILMQRPTQATLLQALTLTNGKPFAAALNRGAAAWKQKQPDPRQRLTEIYHAALGRDPHPGELPFAQADPADVLWALVLQPEFQLIR